MLLAAYNAVGSLVSYVKNAMGTKYYVSQQLAQMQAHSLNRQRIIDKASGPSKKVILDIFQRYDKAIRADEYAWIKKNGLTLIRLQDGKTRSKGGGLITPCDENIHRGIFPPIDGIEATLVECKSNISNQVGIQDWAIQFSSFLKSYVSNLEYWVLTLEALEQDLALSDK